VMDVELSLMGCWRLTYSGRVAHVCHREQRLLALLALYGPTARHRAAGLLWPDATESRALESLRVCLYRAARSAPGAVAGGSGWLSLGNDVQVDLHLLRQELEPRPNRRPEHVLDQLQGLHHAELLPDWDEEWLAGERQGLRQRMVALLQRLTQQLLECGEADRAVEAAEAALALEPLSERAATALARAQAHAGNGAVAVAGLMRFIRLLAEELGLTPTPEVLDTLEQVRGHHTHRSGADE
jgi:SARP family transcriptional regulator, regulator of embCAB operon